MIEVILIGLWLFIPASVSNMFAALSKKLQFLNFLAIPVDMGLTLKGQRLLGNNKTFRGYFAGTTGAMLVGLFQEIIYKELSFASALNFDFNYTDLNGAVLGAILGFGALLGDSIESFFKRRLGIKPGEPWLFFDQTDYIFGALLFSLIYVHWEIAAFVGIFLVYGFGHLIVKFCAFHLGLDDKKI